MVDEAGDIVSPKKEFRPGTVTRVKGNKVRVRFTDTRQPQEITFHKKELFSIREKKDMPSNIRKAEHSS